MRLTEKTAIKISIEFWAWLAKTGAEDKGKWPGWEEYGEMMEQCALCDYDTQHLRFCCSCPYSKRFGHCGREGHPYLEWWRSKTEQDRKYWAKAFLAQLEEL